MGSVSHSQHDILAVCRAMSNSSSSSSNASNEVPRFRDAQRHRTVIHPRLPQPEDDQDDGPTTKPTLPQHTFVVAADTQLGMASQNENWDAETAYSQQAVQILNTLQPRPLFCCMCGDLVDMRSSIFVGRPKAFSKDEIWTENECDRLQDRQNADYQKIWQNVHPDIALVCLCGNHDVGNRPTAATIEKFMNAFGDDYLAFWANGTYNIVLNSNLFSDPTAAMDLHEAQLAWLEQRLKYANQKGARSIFVYSHHPWFLYDENEVAEDLKGVSPCAGIIADGIPDGYFHIPLPYRKRALELFRQHKVAAAFCGHFHQNLQTKTSFGMDLIVTGSLSVVLDSTGNPNTLNEPKEQGFRVVRVKHSTDSSRNNSKPSTFEHEFRALSSFSGAKTKD